MQHKRLETEFAILGETILTLFQKYLNDLRLLVDRVPKNCNVLLDAIQWFRGGQARALSVSCLEMTLFKGLKRYDIDTRRKLEPLKYLRLNFNILCHSIETNLSMSSHHVCIFPLSLSWSRNFLVSYIIYFDE